MLFDECLDLFKFAIKTSEIVKWETRVIFNLSIVDGFKPLNG